MWLARGSLGYTGWMTHAPLDARTVQAIGAAIDLPLTSDAEAARVAAGAQSAIDAVRAMSRLELFDEEPADFLRALELLAADAVPSHD